MTLIKPLLSGRMDEETKQSFKLTPYRQSLTISPSLSCWFMSMLPLSPSLKGPDKCFNEITRVVMQFSTSSGYVRVNAEDRLGKTRLCGTQ